MAKEWNMFMPIADPVAPQTDDVVSSRTQWLIIGFYVMAFALGIALILWGRSPTIAIRTAGTVPEQTIGRVVSAWLRYDLARDATVVGAEAAADIYCGPPTSAIWLPIAAPADAMGPIAVRSGSPAAQAVVHDSLLRLMRAVTPAQVDATVREHDGDPDAAARVLFSAVVRTTTVELTRD